MRNFMKNTVSGSVYSPKGNGQSKDKSKISIARFPEAIANAAILGAKKGKGGENENTKNK